MKRSRLFTPDLFSFSNNLPDRIRENTKDGKKILKEMNPSKLFDSIIQLKVTSQKARCAVSGPNNMLRQVKVEFDVYYTIGTVEVHIPYTSQDRPIVL